ncbi:hypothetical protein KM043_010083 [Ampulex compressa]|nr:hypothetical protein KM043_010083 [Ampulex compressa]
METLWVNTREALKNFTSILLCEECGNKPVTAVRYMNCGHFFCKQCGECNSKCNKCGTPVQLNEISHDHMVANLIRYCDIIADVIDEKDMWNNVTDMSMMSIENNALPRIAPKTPNKKADYVPKTILKNINKRNPKGETTLHTACLKNREEYVKCLLAAGADPNTKDNAGWTPLQEVVNLGYTNICKLLLEAGALPNVPGVENKTALHDAVYHCRLEEVKLLLQYNANQNVYDQSGKRPIDYCTTKEIRDLLKEDDEMRSISDKVVDLNHTFDYSASMTVSKFIIYASNLKDETRKLLFNMASKHKMKVVSSFRSSVTHVIVEANRQNITNLSYDIMLTLLHGNWLLNSEWISLGLEVNDISDIDLELFEVSGAPIPGVPKKARENAEKQNPRLFNKCHFHFALKNKTAYSVGELEFTKEALIKLVTEGGGTVLSREPDPEDAGAGVDRAGGTHSPVISVGNKAVVCVCAAPASNPSPSFTMAHGGAGRRSSSAPPPSLFSLLFLDGVKEGARTLTHKWTLVSP